MHTVFVKSTSMYNAVKSVDGGVCALVMDDGFQVFQSKLDRQNFMAEFGFKAENRREKRRRQASIRRLTERRNGVEQFWIHFDMICDEK